MRKLVIPIAILAILAIGAIGFAHGPKGGSGYGGHMMGPGYGGHMMGSGNMMGGVDVDNEAGKKFLDETADLRRQMHDKKFEYSEARRNPDTTVDALKKIEKEMHDLKWKIREKAPSKDYGRAGGHGCWQ